MSMIIHGINVGIKRDHRCVPKKQENGDIMIIDEPKDRISEMLRERGSRYGDYECHAIITQDLMEVLQNQPNYEKLPQHMKETIHMICHKLGRIVNGDPNYQDSWVDIIGYTQLTLDILEKERIKDDF